MINNPAKWYMDRINKRLKALGDAGHPKRKAIPYVAEKLNLNQTTVWRWTIPKERRTRGTGGLIPTIHLIDLIKVANELGDTEISLEDLVK